MIFIIDPVLLSLKYLDLLIYNFLWRDILIKDVQILHHQYHPSSLNLHFLYRRKEIKDKVTIIDVESFIFCRHNE